MKQDYQEILNFWYDDNIKTHWFNSTKEVDDEIRDRFEPVVCSALEDGLRHWHKSPLGMLANIIVLDQFPLNIYRGTIKSFSGEQKAVELALEAITLQYDKALNKEQLTFLFMPFMHSENMKHQDLAVSSYKKYNMTDNAEFAVHHRNLIETFGRFPHRNQILDRVSTAKELEYLASKEAFTG